MKQNIVLGIAVAVGILALVAASSGVAEIQNANRTGEPGADPTCDMCHGGGNFGTTVQIEVTHPDSAGALDSYLPGTQYLLQIAVNTSVEPAPRYGMQATVVDANGGNAGSFDSPSSNAQLDEDANGRHIVEHNAPSSTNTFSVNWTAPASGGDVTFYAAGMAAGGATNTSGDEPNTASLTLTQAGPVVTNVPELEWSSPALLSASAWQWIAPSAGRFVVADMSGRVVLAKEVANGQQIEWTSDGLTVASFVSNDGTRQSWKLAGL